MREMKTREQVIAALSKLAQDSSDPEVSHVEADTIILEYIGDKDIKKAFDAIEKWYA